MFKTLMNLRPKFAFATQGNAEATNQSLLDSISKASGSISAHKKPLKESKKALEIESKTDRIATPQKKQRAVSIGVLGAKGGSGSSTLALNLAIALSESEKNSTLTDANLQQPDLVVMLGRQPQHSIVEYLARSDELDESIFQACTLDVSNKAGWGRCSLMSGPADGQAATESNLTQLANALAPLEVRSDFIVLDLPKNLDRHLVTLLDKLDLIVLVFEGTISSVAAAKRWLRIFAELAYPADKCALVLNRAGAKIQDLEGDLEVLLGGKDIQRIPNAFSLNQECTSEGQAALVRNPRDKYSISVSKLARNLEAIASGKAAKKSEKAGGER